MAKKAESPWASGPGEILRHGLELLKEDSDTKRRLSMISIDNSVELMMKIYLGLPQRITGLKITRKEYQEFSESFPELLNALEKFASDKLDGIDLGAIEWYHRLRNQLYHQGNGLTVERDKVEVYAELANVLFSNLFGFRLIESEAGGTKVLGDFMLAYAGFEKLLSSLVPSTGSRPMMPMEASRLLHKDGLISRLELAEIDHLRMIRNEIAHGVANHETTLKPEMVKRLRELTSEINEKSKGKGDPDANSAA
jgi:hypothetical protein